MHGLTPSPSRRGGQPPISLHQTKRCFDTAPFWRLKDEPHFVRARKSKRMRWSWKIGKLAGINLYVHATFFLLILWVVMVHWLTGGTLHAVLSGVAFILVLFACVVLHEFGHARHDEGDSKRSFNKQYVSACCGNRQRWSWAAGATVSDLPAIETQVATSRSLVRHARYTDRLTFA